MTELDPDEIVYVDEADGLSFTRRDFPAADFPVGTKVEMTELSCLTGTVVGAHEADGPLVPPATPAEYVPVRWNEVDVVDWYLVDGLKRT